MKIIAYLTACALPFLIISCGGPPVEVHNVTVVKPKPKPKPKPAPDRAEDFRAVETAN